MEESSSDKFIWPQGKADEMTIVSQFQFLSDHLSQESADKLCHSAPGGGFLYELYEPQHLHYEAAFQSYLNFLRVVLSLVHRSAFFSIFPKSCPGCAILQFLCILRIHPILENEVISLLRDIISDPQGDIITRDDIRQLAVMIQKVYKRREDPFPYVAYCLDFDRETKAFKMAQAIGELAKSEKFNELMKKDRTTGAQVGYEMLKDPVGEYERSGKLAKLISRYQELTEETK